MSQLALFDYDQLDTETRIVVQQRTGEIKALMRRTAQDIIEIGAKYSEVRDLLRHNKNGGFEAWAESETGTARRLVYSFISVYETFGNRANFAQLDIAPSALYLLAAPSTPDEIRQEAIDRADNGEQITYTKAKGLVSNHRDPNYQDKDKEYVGSLWSAEGDSENIPDLPPNGRGMDVHYSSNTDEWETPQNLFDVLDKEFNFTLDVCALPENTKCSAYFSPEDDGLKQDWGKGACWMNPPYGDAIKQWVAKAWRSTQAGATAVCLVPARVDTGWWWDYCIKGEIRFIRGRLRFGGGENSAPFPSAVVIFRGNEPSVTWWDDWRN